jgi:alkyl sulfatase BDS1-like metallo-beta-lactamase superfamily hydrolase
MWLDFLAIRMESKKAEGMKFVVNLITPDNGEKYAIEMSNSTLTSIKGYQADKADLTITINRIDLEKIMMGASSFDDQIAAGKATFVGNRKPYEQLKSMLVQFMHGFRDIAGNEVISARCI